MTITVDTNVLLRAAIRDDEVQTRIAQRMLRESERTVITLPSLCEFVWVSGKVYGLTRLEIIAALGALLEGPRLVVDRAAVEAGIALMRSGGDFADGIIAADGRRAGGELFVSFDRQGVRKIAAQGYSTLLLQKQQQRPM